MSELADLAEEVSKDLPASVRKVIETAEANGWELNKPGMTLALRLNHPTDELAQPVYICWAVGRTPTGRMSFKFNGCGTRGLVPLTGADLLEYLADPTVIYKTDEELEADAAAMEEKRRKKWDQSAEVTVNLKNQLGANIIGIEVERKPWAPRRPRVEKPSIDVRPLRVAAPALRVQIPGV